MKVVTATIKGIAPYSSGKVIVESKQAKETHDDFENRIWRQGWKDLAKKLIEQQEDVSNLLADEFYVKLETESSSCS